MDVFEKLYKPKSYVDLYFFSIAIFVAFHLALFCIAVYFYIMKHANEIKSNWSQERCKPQNIPFAGMIMRPSDKSMTQYTEENYVYCQQGIVQSIFHFLLEPFRLMMETLMDIFQELTLAIQALREAYNRLRDMVSQLIDRIMNAIMTVLIPFKQMIIVFEDIIGKFNGVLVTTMYVLLSMLDTFKTSIEVFIEGCIALFSIFVIIIISWFLGVITIPIGIAFLVIYLSFSTPFRVILKFAENVLGIKPSKPMPNDPKKPHHKPKPLKVCFHPSSIIKKGIRIKDIRIGDTLDDPNDIVTGIIILHNDASNKFYSTKSKSNSKSIFVTEFHKIWFENKWIDVKEHPDFEVIDCLEPTNYVYCLLTSSKRIHLEKYCFLDWDDIEDNYIAEIWNDTFLFPANNSHQFSKGLQGFVFLGNNKFQIINSKVKDYNFYAESFLSKIKNKMRIKQKQKNVKN